ncbi:hypothetical protein DI487_10095 [Flavobacterium sediminis]|uniref:Uncharacterized protein n=1 Tax=Flavobacterium sediminis TaxID=2201181 RepID=A0A2U8QVL0_9FLAO|nr:hypothetical protein [Flavobacterium sediminis]AWM14163.1 hypothetical protein DI487_10095 [Flavobacterium sediminis]
MEKNYLEEYKKAIRKKYETEKNGVHSNFLLNPSPAKLRDLCVIILTDSKNQNDSINFRNFLSFEFNREKVRELNDQKIVNKFKPIGKFFKRESELSTHFALDMAALLVNYESRPYPKFTRLVAGNTMPDEQIEKTLPEEEASKTLPSTLINFVDTNQSPEKKRWNPKIVFGLFSLLILFSLGGYYLTKEKAYMVWTEDHFVKYSEKEIRDNPDLPFEKIDENRFRNFKKIIPCDTTTFFKNGMENVWYGKSLKGNEIECFTAPGLHPETGVTLKKITTYIIGEYHLRRPCR